MLFLADQSLHDLIDIWERPIGIYGYGNYQNAHGDCPDGFEEWPDHRAVCKHCYRKHNRDQGSVLDLREHHLVAHEHNDPRENEDMPIHEEPQQFAVVATLVFRDHGDVVQHSVSKIPNRSNENPADRKENVHCVGLS